MEEEQARQQATKTQRPWEGSRSGVLMHRKSGGGLEQEE